MTTSNRQRKPEPGISDAEQLRELTREAHAAIRDLSVLLREARQLLSVTAPQLVDKAMQDKVNAEIAKLTGFLASEGERVSKHMETELAKAREWMMQNLELISVTETPDGLRAEFNRKAREHGKITANRAPES